MIAFAFAIALIGVGIVLVYHFRDGLRHREPTVAAAEPVRRAPDPPPGDDLIEPGEPLAWPMTWTALDDHQLNRLLRDSST